MKCRFCHTELTHQVIDLQFAPPSNAYLSGQDAIRSEVYFPLKVNVCESCFLVQINDYTDSEEIFNEGYKYFSSFSKSWLAHCKTFADKIAPRLALNDQSLVMEVASNDGYLLQYFHEENIPVLGIEPSGATAAAAIEKGIPTIKEFFGAQLATRLKAEGKQSDLLIGNNVLAHVPDINDFVSGLQIVLNASGVLVMEFPHIVNLINLNQFDTIYHEHFSYLSLTTVKNIFNHHGLTVFDVEELTTHGGSLRVYAKQSSNTTIEIENSVGQLLTKESQLGVSTIEYYQTLSPRAFSTKIELLQFLVEKKNNGQSVVAYGAAAKGNTLLNYCGIKNDMIEYVVDRNPYKQNTLMPGSHIPIVDEAKLKETKPDFIFILPWNLKDEIIEQLSYTKEWDAQFVVAIPEFRIL